ncbi:MAG: hypothetical protein ACFFFB_02545 [Candidatus Heimdallarchaeota archaeon]
MVEKKSKNDELKSKEFIDQKIQYGESKVKCFACGENIKLGTEICPYCNTKQDNLQS